MQEDWTVERLREFEGEPVYDVDGEKIGKVDEIFYDSETDRPEWLGIGTGFLRTKRVLVPLADAQTRGDGIFVGYSKEQVKDSPDVDADEISPQDEAALDEYYGLRAGRRGTDVADTATAAEGGTVTRKEEELKVGKRTVEAGHVRLRKWVETEAAEAEVGLTRERAHVERQRIDEPVSGHEFKEEEVDVALHAEEPVVEKQAVAKERVSVGKRTERDTQTVKETVRKERVDVDDDSVENADDLN